MKPSLPRYSPRTTRWVAWAAACAALVLPAYSQSTGSFVIASGTINLAVPDGTGSATHTLQNNSGAPGGAVITELHYRLKIDNDADAANQPRPDDYRISITSAANGSAKALTVFDELGGFRDNGYDDDPDNDRDIEFQWRSTAFFNGQNPNQAWTLNVQDLDDNGSTTDAGFIEFVDLRIFWMVAGPGNPEIRVSPTAVTVDLASQASVNTKSASTSKTSASSSKTTTATDSQKSGDVMDYSDPETDFSDVLGTELVIRFRAPEAAKLHAHSLDSAAQKTKSAGGVQTMKASSISDIDALPPEIQGLTGFASGESSARKLIAADKTGKSVLGKAGAFSKTEKSTLAKTVESGQEAGDAIGLFRADVKEGTDLRALIQTLSKRADVEYVEPVTTAGLLSTPNDPLFGDMWNLAMINITSAWIHAVNSAGSVRVAVIDTGVRADHTELAGRLVAPKDVVPSNGDAYGDTDPSNDDAHGHGTQCAGVIAAIRDNANIMAGIAPVSIIPINAAVIVNGETRISSLYTDGIFWAVDHGANVISCSIGFDRAQGTQAEADAIAYAEAHDVLIVAAAGNDDTATADRMFPAAIPYVISVGAVDDQKRRVKKANWLSLSVPWGSNHGSTVDVCAPGQGNVTGPTETGCSIITLDRGSSSDSRKGFNGTSAATPHVAGLCALLKHINPGLSAAEIRNIVETTAVDQVGSPDEDAAGRDNFHGHGLINAAAAVAMARTNAVTSKVSIFNEGDDILNISSVGVTGGNWLDVSPSGATTVLPGKALELLAVVDRTMVGSGASATIVVNSDDSNEGTLNIPVTVGSGGFGPVVSARSPNSDTVHVLTNNNVNLSVTASDADGDSLTYAWFFDNQMVPAQQAASYGFGTSAAFLGTHSTRVEISDGTHTVSNTWKVIIGQGDPNLVGYWSFENASGKDLSGRGHDLTVQGNVKTTVNGVKGHGLKFGGE